MEAIRRGSARAEEFGWFSWRLVVMDVSCPDSTTRIWANHFVIFLQF
jgi:hypothetical protein